jgi:DNA-binding CsgD family transcriptional regulator
VRHGAGVIDVTDLVGRIATTESISGVWQLATNYYRPLGFSRVNYGLTRFRHDMSIGDPDDALFLTTQSDEYAQLYFRSGFYERTPIYRWILRNTGLTTWRWVHDAYADGRLPPDEAEALRVNARYGIFAGIAISFPETRVRTKGALGLAADPGLDHDDVDAVLAREGPGMLAVAHMTHLKIATLPTRYARRGLTPRQREVLEWVADGKTTQDVAVLLGISVGMVEKHLRLLREALNVETTAHAVAKAAILNLIFTRDEAEG